MIIIDSVFVCIYKHIYILMCIYAYIHQVGTVNEDGFVTGVILFEDLCVCVYMYIHIHIYTHTYTYTYLCVYMHTYIRSGP